MSTIFTINPIKINIISTKNVIKQTIVFIGNVPKEIKHDLMKIESSGNYNVKNKNLIKFYGKNWYIRLGLKKSLIHNKKSGGSTSIIGGDDFSFDDDGETEVQNNSMEFNDETIEQDDPTEDDPTEDDPTEDDPIKDDSIEDDPTEDSLKQLRDRNEPADIKIAEKNLEKTIKEDQNNTDSIYKEHIKDENTILLEDLLE